MFLPAALASMSPRGRRVASSAASSNWAARIADSNVVWYHGFDSAAEVNQFRWTGGYSGGNDPSSNGSGASFLAHVASGGPDGGGFLRSTYPSGNTAGRGNSYWWRPFNPLTGATNGRGSADPGANGTISTAAFSVSDGSTTLLRWTVDASNPGWYGHADSVASNPTEYQGTDFWLQIRVRRADTPGAPPDESPYTSITGKNVWFTTTNSSYTNQELVTYGQSVGNGDTAGVYSRHNVYVGQNFTSLGGGQPNATVTTSNLTLDWRYSGGWDTLLYHITPGTDGGTGSNRTRVEVWAQHDPALYPAEAGVYTKIWDVTYTQGFDGGSSPYGGANLPGWNGMILGSYHNGSQFGSSFNFDYGQIIFSKATIAAPSA